MVLMQTLDNQLIRRDATAATRNLEEKTLQADLVVVGGGLAGTCGAITAARQGMKVILVQDRPVLGGNASSEVRLWALGATAHMGNNARWSREGGVMGELMVENLYRNNDGNPLIFDALLLEWASREPNLTLLLNTAVHGCEKEGENKIKAALAYCSQNETRYRLEAPLFMDASGDGVLAFSAGAAFRMGAESKDEFDEPFAPEGEFGHLLGHSIYFYSKDAGHEVPFVPPAFALDDIKKIPRYRDINSQTHGCRFWWFEWGGRFDTIHETETIKWELWRVVYGVWNYIKNSGEFPDARNMTLEWVGMIPGKRESRRFEGPYIMRQSDVVTRRRFNDAVAHGGWSIDLHPADGVYSPLEGSHHIRLKGAYTIPLRSLYSRNIDNCFLAGRIISTTHVAFGTTRVMCTCAVGAQGAATAAAICRERNILPRQLSENEALVKETQRRLLRGGHYIPGVPLQEEKDLAKQATISASSSFDFSQLPATGSLQALSGSTAQLLPMKAGAVPTIRFDVRAAGDTTLRAELRTSERADEYCPEKTIATFDIALESGDQTVTLETDATIDADRYVFLCLMQNERVRVRRSQTRITGSTMLRYAATHDDMDQIGGENLEYWCPFRRPDGLPFAIACEPGLKCFEPESVANGFARPTNQPNAWVAGIDDEQPTLKLKWDKPQWVRRIEIACDADFDHAMESVQMGHPDRVMPMCVKALRVEDGAGHVLARVLDNHHGDVHFDLGNPVEVSELRVVVEEMNGPCPASLFAVRVYG